jgi:hypothetical protein
VAHRLPIGFAAHNHGDQWFFLHAHRLRPHLQPSGGIRHIIACNHPARKRLKNAEHAEIAEHAEEGKEDLSRPYLRFFRVFRVLYIFSVFRYFRVFHVLYFFPRVPRFSETRLVLLS